ncbi:hypothetical protein [Sphingomonas sp. T9W2]|uniref:hypothetical protein n=1 Tax=Sphingomonas sp. T9W2 TaxID=3143183 RepID=UPI0031F5B3C2
MVDGKGRVPLAEVRVAKTAAGWRATTGFSFTTGNWWGSSSPITDRDPVFPDRASAVANVAAKLADRLSSAPRHAIEPSMEGQRAKIVAWLVGLSHRQPEQFEMFA